MQQQPSGDGPARGTTTFRYDHDSGITYDAETGEVIGEKKDETGDVLGEKKDTEIGKKIRKIKKKKD